MTALNHALHCISYLNSGLYVSMIVLINDFILMGKAKLNGKVLLCGKPQLFKQSGCEQGVIYYTS